jgi:hypothetical protein
VLRDAAVVLLDAIVFIAAGAMRRHVAEGLADHARVSDAPVHRDLLGGMANSVEDPQEEPLGRTHVAPLTE